MTLSIHKMWLISDLCLMFGLNLFIPSQKYTYIILAQLHPILFSKTGVYRGTNYFSYFCLKT